jgi:hypothetical protein
MFASAVSSHAVEVQGECESKCLKLGKPGFHFIGSRVKSRRFPDMGQLDSTCTALPGGSDGAHEALGEGAGGGGVRGVRLDVAAHKFTHL